MKRSHTPGPWTLDVVVRNTVVRADFDGVSLYIATMSGNSTEPNARLIAAAPDLLEASDRMLKLIFDEIGLTREQIKLVHATGLIEAITKARGES